MLSLVGLGLRDGDISVNGVEVLSEADVAYAEFYTNTIDYDLDTLEEETGTTIKVLDREGVEDEDRVLAEAEQKDVVFLVSGDPLAATTHQDILFRVRQRGIETEVIPAPSVFTAVAETGLSLYKFGRTTTLTVQNGEVPPSVFDAIDANQEQGLHTLVLVDPEMDAGAGMDGFAGEVDGEVLVCSSLGTPDQTVERVRAETIDVDSLVEPVSLVVPGSMGPNEEERLESV